MIFNDEIIEIIEIEEEELIDIEVNGNHLFYANGILTHNSGVEAQGEFSFVNGAGGISKINTADNILYINAPPHMKEKGEYELIFGKTRTAAAVGHRIKMHYDNGTMRISDGENGDTILKPLNQKELRELYQSDEVVLMGKETENTEETSISPVNFIDNILKDKLKGRDTSL